MKILAIGNSFSQDATRYLRQIAHRNGEKWEVINLYIGGCSLYTHYINALEDKRAYSIQLDAEDTGFFASIKEGLISREWDVITLQQASFQSPEYETYQPYLDFLADYVRKYAPKAKLYVHQVWAYEDGSDLLKQKGCKIYSEMFEKSEKAYNAAFEAIKADGLIPSGKLMQRLLLNGIKKIHRDTFHLSWGLGRYAAGLLWYALLGNKDVDDVSFCDFDEPVTEDEIRIAKEQIKALIAK